MNEKKELTPMEKEIKTIIEKLEADRKVVYEKYKDYEGLDGPAAKECRQLTREAFNEIDRVHEKYKQ
jgi:hypothetical protein